MVHTNSRMGRIDYEYPGTGHSVLASNRWLMMSWSIRGVTYTCSSLGKLCCMTLAYDDDDSSYNRGYGESVVHISECDNTLEAAARIDQAKQRAINTARHALAIEPYPARWESYD